MNFKPQRTSLTRAFATGFTLTTGLANAFTLIKGEVIEITKPSDLFLDPPTNVIAVNVVDNGFGPLSVNGVDFLGDSDEDGFITPIEGITMKDSITVTTSRDNAPSGGGELPTWAPAPIFEVEDDDFDSADNLGIVMRSIRWANGSESGALDITIEGLTGNTNYDIQLLFNEGKTSNDRRFDIEVEGSLVADDFSSQGGDGTYTDSNSFAYRGVFAPGADGILNIKLATDLGGEAFQGADGNPIINAIIVHSGPDNTAPTDIFITEDSIIATAAIGSTVGTLSSEDPDSSEHTYELVAGEGDTDNASFSIDGAELKTAADLSGPGASSYSIRVRSTDPTSLSYERVLTVMTDADDDADNLLDSWEIDAVGNLTDLSGTAIGPGPGAGTGDFDGDNSLDLAEQTNGTNPNDPDSDDDDSTDGQEAINGTNPLIPDTDEDNLNDGAETVEMTDPLNPDSDGDTILDGDEIANGTDPNEEDTDDDGFNDDVDGDPLDPNVFSRTKVISGRIIEFKSPEDLGLNADGTLIAVNVFGEDDYEINGVDFFTDTFDDGVVTFNGVTVTIDAENELTSWAAAPLFTGADEASVESLGLVMQDIRWSEDPAPISITIEGLPAGETYEVQLLVNEGSATRIDRVFDIAVEGNLVVDNFTSRGRDGIDDWAADNSFAYSGSFTAPENGTLNILMQDDLGGDPQFPTGLVKGNPILQGLIVKTFTPPLEVTGVEADLANNMVTLTWSSVAGASYSVDFADTLAQTTDWANLENNVQSQGDSTSVTVTIPVEDQESATGFFRVSKN